MKQIVQSYRSGEMQLLEVPSPLLKPQGYLVKTAVSLVSAGTEKMIVDLAKKSLVGKAASRPDLVRQVMDKVRQEGLMNTAQKVFSKLNQPIPLGYSLAGRVLQTGGLAREILPGARVACAGAGYANHAEINYLPQNLVVPIPDQVSDQEAAFVTLGAIALQGVRRLGPRLGEKVGVLGLGLLGQITVQLLKANGCQVIGSDLDPAKIELALELGADRAVNAADLAQAAQAFSNGRGLDGVIITASSSSSEPVTTAGHVSRLGGRVVVVGLVGMEVPRNLYYSKELDLALSMSYGPGRYDPEFEERGHDYPFAQVRWTEQRNMEAFLDLLAAKRVDVSRLVTHRFPFEQVQEAYALFEQKEQPYLGILLTYPEETPERGKVELAPKKAAAKGDLGVGMIGAGNFARGVLLPALAKSPAVQLVCLAAAGGHTAHSAGENFGFASISSRAEEVIGDPRVEAVFITTPHQLHAEQVSLALAAGKHVFVEKPLAIDQEQLAGIEEVWQGLARDGKPQPCLMVGFNRRFSPLAVELKNRLAARGGPCLMTYRVNGGPIPREHWIQKPREGGGRLVGEACHFIDLMHFFCGAPPMEVAAMGVESGDSRFGPDEVCALLIKFADGSLGNLVYSALGNKGLAKERVEVLADDAAYLLDNFRALEWREGGKAGKTRLKAQAKGFKEEVAAFVLAARQGGPSPIPFPSLAAVTRATFAALQALYNAAVVRL